MRKYYIIFIIALFLAIGLIGYFNVKSQKAKPLADLNADNIKSIIIKTQILEDSPQEKIITDNEDIREVIEYFSKLKYKEQKGQVDENGWQFWLIFDGWDKNITYQGNYVIVGGVRYEVKSKSSEEFMKIYKSLKSSTNDN
ncbi:MAG: hypothetical protein K0R92_2027 [Lachnospiraceae bacterium]|jgi:hypothetical protein|nr:hypothetical protein [Lachnospiraceae bacterium]